MKLPTWTWIAAGIILCGLLCLPSAADTPLHARDATRQDGNLFNETPGKEMGPGMAVPDAANFTPHDRERGNRTAPDGTDCTPSDVMKPGKQPPDAANWTPQEGMIPDGTPHDGMKGNRTAPDGTNCTPSDAMKPGKQPPDAANWTPPDGMKGNGTFQDGMQSGTRSEHRGLLSGLSGIMTALLNGR